MTRVCRVVPDVAAVTRAFDYTVPDELASALCVGAIVRVGLHGRRVRGWVVADDVTSTLDIGRLQPLAAVSSAGPPADVVELCRSVAFRCAGPIASVLKSASPANNVRPGSISGLVGGPGGVALAAPTDDVEHLADTAASSVAGADSPAVVRWPPLSDRRRLVAQLLAEEGSTIVVIADGVRAASFARWLHARGTRTALLHSDLPASARTAAWAEAARGACVVVGGRMAAFAPVPDLAVAIIVDEGDEALQEERSPTWHARDVLADRCRTAAARCVIISPAPTLHALAYLAPPQTPISVHPAAQAAGWPRVEVVDLADQPPGIGLLTERLVTSLRIAIGAGDRAVCVLNRRGAVRLVACRECGAVTRWDAEGRPAWDVDPADATAVRPTFCPHCSSTRLRVIQAGVKRLAAELSALLHGTSVAQVDTTIAIAPDAAVLVGTEAVLHRIEVRRSRPALVAFVDFDQELFAPRYRASEQAQWLLVRAAHLLAGRGRSSGRVLLQTTAPDHEVILAAVHGEPERVTEVDREQRKRYDLPPFCVLAELSGELTPVQRCVSELEQLDAPSGVSVVGPTPIGTKTSALVRAPDRDTLAEALSIVVPRARETGNVRVHVDPARI